MIPEPAPDDFIKGHLLARLRLCREATFEEAWEVLLLNRWVSSYEGYNYFTDMERREDRARARSKAKAKAKAKSKAKA